jgi:hypothetical protein
MFAIPAADWRRASPRLRDEFLDALEAHDPVALRAAAASLVGCVNPLPSVTCVRLGLQAGSTYGEGARAVVVLLDAA